MMKAQPDEDEGLPPKKDEEPPEEEGPRPPRNHPMTTSLAQPVHMTRPASVLCVSKM